MDPESLKIFCAVANELSVTQAAARLGRAPSNVTTRIQNLEAHLGVELFVRSGKRMHLSTAGERLVGYAQRLLSLQDEAEEAVAGGREGGMLRIGSMESTAASRLPRPLASLCKTHPSVRLEVSTGTSQSLLDAVRTGRLDCAFVALQPGLDDAAALAELGLQARAVWKETLVLLLPPNEKARTLGAVQTRSLAAFRQGCVYRAIAQEALGIDGDPKWSVQEMGSYHAMVAGVAAGACVSLLPKSVLGLTAPASPALRTLKVGTATTWLLSRAGFNASPFQALTQALDGEPA